MKKKSEAFAKDKFLNEISFHEQKMALGVENFELKTQVYCGACAGYAVLFFFIVKKIFYFFFRLLSFAKH